MTIQLISLLIGLFPVVLKGIPGISSTIQQIITDVTASVATILGSGVVTQPSLNTALSAWAGIIQALKNDPNLPKDSLNAVAELEKIVQAVLLEDQKLAASVDWSQFKPITPVA